MEELISPFDESTRETFRPATRLDALGGRSVTLLSISKPKSAEFLVELGRVLEEEHGAKVRHAQKPTFARPAPAELVDSVAASSDAVVEALAD
jgi:hypothetical protein